MPAAQGGTPVVFRSFPTAKLATETYKILAFWIKPQTGGSLDVVLPIHKWETRLVTSVTLSDKVGKWTRVRLRLNEDMGLKDLKNWTLKDLRGEFFIYNGAGGQGKHPVRFQITGAMLE